MIELRKRRVKRTKEIQPLLSFKRVPLCFNRQESVVSAWNKRRERIISKWVSSDWCVLLLKTTHMALKQWKSSTRCLILQHEGRVVMSNRREHARIFQVIWLHPTRYMCNNHFNETPTCCNESRRNAELPFIPAFFSEIKNQSLALWLTRSPKSNHKKTICDSTNAPERMWF